MSGAGNGAAWGSVAAGLASVATLPLAVFLTRFSDAYELLDAGFAVPVGLALAAVALVLARRARVAGAVRLQGPERAGVARAGRVLGVVGMCMAAAGLVALGVYGLLEYVGSRE